MSGAFHRSVALVTGAARGLGEAIARMLTREGATVICCDRNAEAVAALAAELRVEGAQAEGLGVDLVDASAVEMAVTSALVRHERLDILVNNAGIDFTLPMDELSVEQWDRVLDTNLRGAFLTAHYTVPYMKAARRGHVINVVSTAARRAWPNATAFHASKWGLLGLSHAMHAELRPFGIKVSALIAGGMRTPFLLERFPDIDVATLQSPASVAEALRWCLMTPAESVVPELMVLPLAETSWP
ncbi:MAG: SDR family oxidoreductase [Gammaproteobacteria bacterium]